MSVRRLVLTAAAMALIATALAGLTPAAGEMAGALADPQRTVDTAGPDSLVVAAAALLAWAVWGWGALGLTLTAASALPGMIGATARLAAHALLPASARRSAAVLLGIGLGVAAPLGGVTVPLAGPAAAATSVAGVPDWPAAPTPTPSSAAAPAAAPQPPPVPDWPADPSAPPEAGSHVVVRGDCLWHIAETRLLEQTGVRPTQSDIARAVHDWWTANADVIGPDPDRLLPGQLLRPPETS